MGYPCRRGDGVVVSSFGGEAIVVDERSGRAHQLSVEAVRVWECCDGCRSVQEIAVELGLPVGVVESVVCGFAGEGLLADETPGLGVVDRRGLLRGAAVMGVPLMVSVALPAASVAASTGVVSDTFALVSTLTFTSPFAVAFSPVGGWLAVVDDRADAVVVYSVATSGSGSVSAALTQTLSYEGVIGVELYSLAFSPDGRWLAVTNNLGGNSYVYSVTVGASLPVATAAAASILVPEAGPVAFNGAGTMLAVAGSGRPGATPIDYGSLVVYQFTSSASDPVVSSPAQTVSFNPGDLLVSVAFSPDGSLLALVDQTDQTVLVYPVSEGAADPLGAPQTLSGFMIPAAVAFSPDGTLLAVAYATGKVVRVYPVTLGTGGGADTVTASPVASLTLNYAPRSVAFSPDGTLLAVAGFAATGGQVQVYPVTAGAPDTVGLIAPAALSLPSGANPQGVAFSPDSTLLAVIDGNPNDVVYLYQR